MTEAQKTAKYGPVIAEVGSSSDDRVYQVRIKQGGLLTAESDLSCNCRGWAIRKMCKHARGVAEAERASVGVVIESAAGLKPSSWSITGTLVGMNDLSDNLLAAWRAHGLDPFEEALVAVVAGFGGRVDPGFVKLRAAAARLRGHLSPAVDSAPSVPAAIGVRRIVLDD